MKCEPITGLKWVIIDTNQLKSSGNRWWFQKSFKSDNLIGDQSNVDGFDRFNFQVILSECNVWTFFVAGRNIQFYKLSSLQEHYWMVYVT